MIDLKELREATENITSGKALFRYANAEKLKTNFTMATKPNVILELLDRLEAAEKVCASLFTDFCEWQLDVDALKGWQDKYEKQYLTEYEAKAALEEKL